MECFQLSASNTYTHMDTSTGKIVYTFSNYQVPTPDMHKCLPHVYVYYTQFMHGDQLEHRKFHFQYLYDFKEQPISKWLPWVGSGEYMNKNIRIDVEVCPMGWANICFYMPIDMWKDERDQDQEWSKYGQTLHLARKNHRGGLSDTATLDVQMMDDGLAKITVKFHGPKAGDDLCMMVDINKGMGVMMNTLD